MKHPFNDLDFKIRWQQLTPAHVVPDTKRALRLGRAQLRQIAVLPLGRVNFDNTILALEKAILVLDETWAKVTHLDGVCNSPQLRLVYNKMLPQVSGFYTRIMLNRRLWARVEYFAQSAEAQELKPLYKRLLDETVKDFEQLGARLNKKQQNELEKVDRELARLTQKFSENVLDATNAFELIVGDETQLAGLPEVNKNIALHSALDKNLGDKENPRWRFTLQAPYLNPVLTYLEDEGIRKQMFEAHIQVGRQSPYENARLIKKILHLRQRKARLLGFANFADYILQRRMAKQGQKALGFIEQLQAKIIRQFAADNMELEAFKAKETGDAAGHLEAWERSFWSEKKRKKEYDFDEEELRPYFPINKVISGLLAIAEKLYTISIVEEPLSPEYLWHPDVKYYNVYDGARHIGSFYADWHPREAKRGGAWMDSLKTGALMSDGKLAPHLGFICGNLTPPSGDDPALLTHHEVETIFHEFGHLMHHLLGEVEVKSLNGTNVAWDFVELPSQIMENWCWDKQSLDLFTRHYKTNEVIPSKLYRKMVAARNFQSALFFMRQLSLAKMDLELHINFTRYQECDLDELLAELLKDYLPPLKKSYPTIINQFNHLFASSTGYAAGYYSYKWAEVLDADVFTRFSAEGILNPQVGRDFRRKILSRGNETDPEKLFFDFMGRDPDMTALLKRSGLE